MAPGQEQPLQLQSGRRAGGSPGNSGRVPLVRADRLRDGGKGLVACQIRLRELGEPMGTSGRQETSAMVALLKSRFLNIDIGEEDTRPYPNPQILLLRWTALWNP